MILEGTVHVNVEMHARWHLPFTQMMENGVRQFRQHIGVENIFNVPRPGFDFGAPRGDFNAPRGDFGAPRGDFAPRRPTLGKPAFGGKPSGFAKPGNGGKVFVPRDAKKRPARNAD